MFVIVSLTLNGLSWGLHLSLKKVLPSAYSPTHCFIFVFACGVTGPCDTQLPELSQGSSGPSDGQPVHHRPAVLHLHSGWRPGDEEQTHHIPAPEVQHPG